MTGHNTLTINQATMIEAMQDFVNKITSDAAGSPVVKRVKADKSGQTDSYVLELVNETPADQS